MLAICPTLLHPFPLLSFPCLPLSFSISLPLLLLLILVFYTYRVFLLYSSILHLAFDYRPLIKLAGLALRFLAFLHPFRPEHRRHSFDPSWYNESVLLVRRVIYRGCQGEMWLRFVVVPRRRRTAGLAISFVSRDPRVLSRNILTTYACPSVNITDFANKNRICCYLQSVPSLAKWRFQ